MPKHALFSDVHANLEALAAVARDFSKVEGLRHIWSLGDLVGYGPNPNEVIQGLEALAKRGYQVHYCMGNHDGAATGRYEFVNLHEPGEYERLKAEAGLKDFEAIALQYRDPKRRKYIPVRANAKLSTIWTRQHLTEASKEFLATRCKDYLPLGDGVLCVHGSPRDPLFDYVTNARRVQRAAEAPLMGDNWLCFLGHTHIPGLWQFGPDDIVTYAGHTVVMHPPKEVEGTSVRLGNGGPGTVINVGAVGQPRDGDPRAAYVIYDEEARTIELRRVGYDVARTRQKIVESGLPEDLARRLGQGQAEEELAEGAEPAEEAQ